MKKFLTLAITLFAVSAFAAGVVFKANPLALLQSGGGGDKDKKASTEQVAAEQTTKTNAKQKAGELLNAKRAATSDNERLRINAELVKSGNIRFLTPQEIEAVKKSGLLITSHDTGWQEVAAEQPKTITQSPAQKVGKDTYGKMSDKYVRIGIDANNQSSTTKTLTRDEYINSDEFKQKEHNFETDNHNKKQ